MSDFLGRLAARTLGKMEVIRPRLPALYEPRQHGGGLLSERQQPWTAQEITELADDGAAAAPSLQPPGRPEVREQTEARVSRRSSAPPPAVERGERPAPLVSPAVAAAPAGADQPARFPEAAVRPAETPLLETGSPQNTAGAAPATIRAAIPRHPQPSTQAARPQTAETELPPAQAPQTEAADFPAPMPRPAPTQRPASAPPSSDAETDPGRSVMAPAVAPPAHEPSPDRRPFTLTATTQPEQNASVSAPPSNAGRSGLDPVRLAPAPQPADPPVRAEASMPASDADEWEPAVAPPRFANVAPLPLAARRPAPAARALAMRGDAELPSEPPVRITIGRVEVRAVFPETQARRAPPPPKPTVSLDEYLSRGARGR
jgi:hypothetical protein